MNFSKTFKYLDFFFCLIFLPLVINLVPVGKLIVNYPWFFTTLLTFLYCVYFAVKKMRIPRKIIQHKYLQVIVFCAAISLAAFAVSRFPYPAVNPEAYKGSNEMYQGRRIQTVWFMYLVVFGYSLSISLIVELFRQNIKKNDLLHQKKMAELALYRAQINPHFFFNTLNTLYGLVVTKSDNTEHAFTLFSDIMKFTYTLADKDVIPIKEEIIYIKNYIELQRIRLNKFTNIIFTDDIDNSEIMIPPMILIPFVENAFKYGTSSKTDSEIKISVILKDNVLNFLCSNDIMKQRKTERPTVGIENTTARLNISYPGQFKLSVSDKKNIYTVNLKIRLQ